MKPDREKEREGRERRLRKLIRGYKSINLKIIQWPTTCVCETELHFAPRTCDRAIMHLPTVASHHNAAVFCVDWPPAQRQLKHKMPSQVSWILNAAWLLYIHEWTTYYSKTLNSSTHLTRRILILLYDLQFKQSCWHYLQLRCLHWMQNPLACLAVFSPLRFKSRERLTQIDFTYFYNKCLNDFRRGRKCSDLLSTNTDTAVFADQCV